MWCVEETPEETEDRERIEFFLDRAPSEVVRLAEVFRAYMHGSVDAAAP